MRETLQLLQLFMSVFIAPAAIYIIRLEKRLARLEFKLDQICKTLERRRTQRK